ncbi:HlyD family efflux transporter periplasmic adaptor subunit, partial [Frankia sp. CiP1_Cm_nod2]|uniref:HlyD family efflux transporter periplasmic adaptor subunit n=1 Tax=Frankia sp. CiP1_Cm_nod2 TaxID=2897161 RepID=UPI0020259CC3
SGAGGSRASGAGSAGGSRAPASAAQIAADQAAVDAANAVLLVAQQSLEQARMVSPISGLVAAVNIASGQSVGTGSSTATIVVLNPDAKQVTTTVSDSDLAAVKIGARARITPDGTSSPLTGTVVAVGLLPAASTASGGTASAGSSGSSSGVAYPVTIGLDDGGGKLFAGSGTAVAIVTASATDALAVPTSAVLRIGNRYVVSVLRDGRATSVPVRVGAVGPAFTQVTSGLSEGDKVVLADLNAPLPTGNTTPRGLGGAGIGPAGRGLTGGRGGLTGGGGAGGGGFVVNGGGGGRSG